MKNFFLFQFTKSLNFSKFIFLLFGLKTAGVCANAWEESFLGLGRSVHLDALGPEDRKDPFSVSGNPAWHSEKGSAGIVLARQRAWLGDRISENPKLTFMGLALQRHFSFFKTSFLAVIPLGESLVLDTGPVSGAVSPLFSSTSQIQIQPAIAIQPSEGSFSFGVAVPVAFNTTAEANLNFDQNSSTSRFKAGIHPNASFIAGVWYQISDRLQVSMSYREQQKSFADIMATTKVPLPGGLDVAISGKGRSPYLFEPRRVHLQSSIKASSVWTIGACIRYAQWSSMPAPYLRLQFLSPSLTSQLPVFVAQDTVQFGFGLERQLGIGHRLISGYLFQPTPFRLAPHYYDRNQHHLAFGYVWQPLEQGFLFYSSLRGQFLEGGGLYSYLGLGLGWEL